MDRRIAMLTGSFDPITAGHMDLIKRSAAIFDEVYVVAVVNTEKKSGVFTPEERICLIEAAVSELDCDVRSRVHAITYSGLTSDAAHMLGARYIVRGARCATDFDYEYNLSLIMKRFDPELETVIFAARPELIPISSTYVRDLLKYGCDLGDAVPEKCRLQMREIYGSKKL